MFSRLYKRVWNNKHLKKGTKISVYQAVVLTTLLYGAESWVTYHHYLQLLECSHLCCLCTILNIHWSNYVSNVEVLNQAKITSIEAMLLKLQLQWAGHVSRTVGGHCLPKIALYSEHSIGYYDRGHQRNILKTPSRRPLVLATLTTTSGRHHLLTVRPGGTLSTKSSPPLRTPTEPTSGKNTTGGRSRELQQLHQTRPLTAVTAAGLAYSTSA